MKPHLVPVTKMVYCRNCDEPHPVGPPQWEWAIKCPNCRAETIASNYCQFCAHPLPQVKIEDTYG